MKKRISQKGFSLIELIIVIAILAVIAAIAVPNLIDNINDSRKQADVTNAKAIATAVAQVYAENETATAQTFDDAEEFTDTAYDGTLNDDTDILHIAASKLQAVPEVKYAGNESGSGTAGFYVYVDGNGTIFVYGDSAGDHTDTSDTLYMLFPNVDTNWQ